jgi:ATP-binding protein involved in chromosome partitioning
MKYVVPITGGRLSPHFGHSEAFTFFDVEESCSKILNRETFAPPAHETCVLPQWLAEKGAEVVIAGGMGTHAADLLHRNGVEVVLGAMESDPEQAVLCHLSGSLATGDNACDHGGHRCAHHTRQ